MKKYILHSIFLCFCTVGHGQNLVNNPSFESIKFGGCVSPISPIGIAVASDTILNSQTVYYWNDAYYCNPNLANWAGGAVIYTRNCGMVPNAQLGNPEPKDGNAYIAIGIINNDKISLDRRSYLQTILSQQMQSGSYYKVSFWARLPFKNSTYKNRLAPNAIAAYITSNRPVNCIDSIYGFINAQPQITLPVNKFIDDTANWQLVCGYYLAQGGERWLTIGNFYDSVHTKLKSVLIDSTLTIIDSLYSICFVDLVSVELANTVFTLGNKNAFLCDTINGNTTLNATTGYLKYKWNTGDTMATIIVHKPGKYWVRATDECGTLTDTAYVTYMPPKRLVVSNDTVKCNDSKPTQLAVNAGFQKYEWSTGDTSLSILVTQTGNYWVRVYYECGIITDTVHVIINPIPDKPIVSNWQYCINDTVNALTAVGNNLIWYMQQTDIIGSQQAPIPSASTIGTIDYYVTQTVNNCESSKAIIKVSVIDKPFFYLGNDTIICNEDSILLSGNNFTYSYLWQDKDTSIFKRIYQKGLYILTAKNQCGVFADSIEVNTKSCVQCIQFPNAFSPNNDGVNDLFFPRTTCEITDYHLQIYNRWGNKVFESYNVLDKWNGENAMQDIYIIICDFLEGNTHKTIKRNLLLLR